MPANVLAVEAWFGHDSSATAACKPNRYVTTVGNNALAMAAVFVIVVARGGLLTISCDMHVVACVCCGLHGAGPILARLQDLVASQQLQRDEGQVRCSRHQARAHSQHSHHHQRQLHCKADVAQRLSPSPTTHPFWCGASCFVVYASFKQSGMSGRASVWGELRPCQSCGSGCGQTISCPLAWP